MIIGLIGGSGTGKSLVCDAARALEFHIIDADAVGHAVMAQGQPAYHQVVAHFGAGILLPNGEIDRKALGQIVFHDPQQLQALNQMVHPHITRTIEGQLTPRTIIDGAVLHQTPLLERCDMVIAVSAPLPLRVQRICKRDGISQEQARSRIASQPTDCQYERLATIVLHNDGDDAAFLQQAHDVLAGVID